ncbi:MAG: hypothetical protein D3916_05670 [Candidatus Electrothrix sp. MAN1_4]|nr:hypothetical protein [Candidatus Electrothrix sp. MAN1_4]
MPNLHKTAGIDKLVISGSTKKHDKTTYCFVQTKTIFFAVLQNIKNSRPRKRGLEIQSDGDGQTVQKHSLTGQKKYFLCPSYYRPGILRSTDRFLRC